MGWYLIRIIVVVFFLFFFVIEFGFSWIIFVIEFDVLEEGNEIFDVLNVMLWLVFGEGRRVIGMK